MLLVTASGVFGQMQRALNVIWKASPAATGVSRLVKARLQSLGLVVTLGFLLMVSLLAGAAVTALGDWLNGILPGLSVFMQIVGFAVSFGLVAALFGAIYKVLPDRQMEWRDVIVGAVATAFLFNVGKQAIALYIGSSRAATAYGAAAAFVIMLLWIYYSAQIFLLGAEFTKAYAEVFGSHKAPASSGPADGVGPATTA
jgi:membrane protein